MNDDKAVAIVSGGMDSVVLLHKLIKGDEYRPENVLALSFNYGQRHRKELRYAHWQANHLGVEHRVVDLTSVTELLGGSALTDDAVAVPEGHYTADSMKATVVPNRNMIMLSLAETFSLGVKAGVEPLELWTAMRMGLVGKRSPLDMLTAS